MSTRKKHKIIGLSILVVTVLFIISVCSDVYFDIKNFTAPVPIHHILNYDHFYFNTILCGALLICLLSIILFLFLRRERKSKKN